MDGDLISMVKLVSAQSINLTQNIRYTDKNNILHNKKQNDRKVYVEKMWILFEFPGNLITGVLSQNWLSGNAVCDK